MPVLGNSCSAVGVRALFSVSRLRFGAIVEDLLRFRDIPAFGSRRSMNFPIENIKAEAGALTHWGSIFRESVPPTAQTNTLPVKWSASPMHTGPRSPTAEFESLVQGIDRPALEAAD